MSLNSNWTPDEQKLELITQLIGYTQSTDNAKQKEAFEKFSQLQNNREFVAYAAIIFANNNLSIKLRRGAGLLMKESLRKELKANKIDVDNNNTIFSICKHCLLQCLTNEYSNLEEKFIANTSAITICSIICETTTDDIWQQYYQQNGNNNNPNVNTDTNANTPLLNFDTWPELIENLLQLLSKHQNNNPVLQSILYTISMIAEDCGYILGNCEQGDMLLSALISFSRHNIPQIRIYCLKSLLYLFQFQPNSLLKQMQQYCKLVLDLMQDQNTQIKKIIAETLIALSNEFWHFFESNTQAIFDYLLQCLQSDCDADDTDSVAVYAGEFWSLYASDTNKPNAILIQFFPKLIPVMVFRCRYTMEMLSAIDFENDHQSNADLAENIAPKFYTSRQELNSQTKSQLDEQLSQGKLMDQEQTEWNIRKCCAHQLEVLSRIKDIKAPLMKILLPIVENSLKSDVFLDREAGLLALGAVTETPDDIPQLAEFVPFLIEQTTHKHLLVRQIAYWAMIRLGKWYNSDDGSKFFEPVFQCCLAGMKDESKRVQRSACGSLAIFVSQTKFKIVQQKYIESLMNVFLWGFKNYHLGNYSQLIDAIISTTDVIANDPSGNGKNILCMPSVQDALLPPIITRWLALEQMSTVGFGLSTQNNNDCEQKPQENVRKKQKEYDTNIFPLIEAITRWTAFMGSNKHFQETYMKDLFFHALDLAVELKNAAGEYQDAVNEARACFTDNSDFNDEMEKSIAMDEPNKEFWVCALDLLAVLIETCGPVLLELIWSRQADHTRLLTVLLASIEDKNFAVRRNALALLGDLCKHCKTMAQHIHKFMPLLLNNLVYSWQTVCTNSSWVIGQCIANFPKELMKRYQEDILYKLIIILKAEKAPEFVNTNAAITLALLVDKFPEEIIQHWNVFAVEWITALGKFQEDCHKVNAFETLMKMVIKNPAAVVCNENGLQMLFWAISIWKEPPKELNALFVEVINGFKGAAPDWNKIIQSLTDDVSLVLQQRYNI